jgi:SAM-dependent methyltransferase
MDKKQGLKINIGCGRRMIDGWTNCDIVRHPDALRDPELLCDAKEIPLPDGCADEVMAIHVWEHFPRWESENVLTEWRRLLRSGGLLILELPDLIKCCQNYIDGVQKGGKDPDQLARWGIYGDPRLNDEYMLHKWGWAPKELIKFLRSNGFADATQKLPIFHPSGRKHRDMRIEAIKA